jgi:hypothetical protein
MKNIFDEIFTVQQIENVMGFDDLKDMVISLDISFQNLTIYFHLSCDSLSQMKEVLGDHFKNFKIELTPSEITKYYHFKWKTSEFSNKFCYEFTFLVSDLEG